MFDIHVSDVDEDAVLAGSGELSPAETVLTLARAKALAAGIDCVVVHHEFTASQDFSGATHRIATLAELKEVLG